DRGQGPAQAAPPVAIQETPELPRGMNIFAARAHSSTAERPAHNRSGLGSNPGGPTFVSEREIASHRGWPEIDASGCASVSEQEIASHRGWPAIEARGFAPQSTVLSMETTWTHSSRPS